MHKKNNEDLNIRNFQCSICRSFLYRDGERKEIPIVCECGKSKIDMGEDNELKYTNIMTEIDGKIYEVV